MTLRARLTLFFVLIVVVPLVGTGLVVGGLVRSELNRRADGRLSSAASAVAALRAERLDRAAAAVSRVAADLKLPAGSNNFPAIRAATALDFLILATSDGRVVAADARAASFEVPQPAPERIAAQEHIPGVDRFTVRLGKGLVLDGGLFEDRSFVAALAVATRTGVLVLDQGRVIASSGSAPRMPPVLGSTFSSGGVRVRVLPDEPSTSRLGVYLRPEGSVLGVERLFGLFVAVGMIIATLLGWALARIISRPLDDVSSTALAISRGELGRRVPVAGKGETARLAAAFNQMAEALQSNISDLRGSRDELRGTLERLGAALGSTGDLDEMLPAILHAAAATLGARSGTMYRMKDVGVVAAATLGDLGDGAVSRAAATVVATGSPALIGDAGVAAVPLRRGKQLIGVLALAGGKQAFEAEDLMTLETFAMQASVAIDNVLLREEAERASLTDALTGARNRRYLEQLLSAEVERASRYGHPLSVVMIDIDHFKQINDRYGHARGDRVLAEVCKRIEGQIRGGIDTLARYGGEEFVIVLPETPTMGAAAVASKVLDAVAAREFGDETLWLTVSGGVATFPSDVPGEQLLDAADQALYRAKRAGRARFEVCAAEVVV